MRGAITTMASSAVSDEVMVDASSKAQAPVADGTGGSDDYFAFDASLCTATEAEAAAKAWCDATGAAASDVEGSDGAAAGGVDVVNALLASGAGDPEAAGEARSQQYERVRYLGEGQYARVYQYVRATHTHSTHTRMLSMCTSCFGKLLMLDGLVHHSGTNQPVGWSPSSASTEASTAMASTWPLCAKSRCCKNFEGTPTLLR